MYMISNHGGIRITHKDQWQVLVKRLNFMSSASEQQLSESAMIRCYMAQPESVMTRQTLNAAYICMAKWLSTDKVI